MTPDDIKQARAVCEAATPGPLDFCPGCGEPVALHPDLTAPEPVPAQSHAWWVPDEEYPDGWHSLTCANCFYSAERAGGPLTAESLLAEWHDHSALGRKVAGELAAARTHLPAALDALEEKDAELEQSRAREAQVEKELREAVGLLRGLIVLRSDEPHEGEWASAWDGAAEFVFRFDEEG